MRGNYTSCQKNTANAVRGTHLSGWSLSGTATGAAPEHWPGEGTHATGCGTHSDIRAVTAAQRHPASEGHRLAKDTRSLLAHMPFIHPDEWGASTSPEVTGHTLSGDEGAEKARGGVGLLLSLS